MFFDGSIRSARATIRRPPTSARSAAAAAAHSAEAASSVSTPASGPSGATNVAGAFRPAASKQSVKSASHLWQWNPQAA